jgi:hypothetical protein
MTRKASSKKTGVKQEEVIAWEDEDGFCKYCGWCSDYPVCHTEHSVFGWGLGKQAGCKYIESKYKFEIVDGEMVWVGYQIACQQ